jgi:hypothetical protein
MVVAFFAEADDEVVALCNAIEAAMYAHLLLYSQQRGYHKCGIPHPLEKLANANFSMCGLATCRKCRSLTC